MASKGPKSGKPTPAVAKPKPKPAAVKAPVEPTPTIAAPAVEKKKPAPKVPVAAKPAPAPIEPEPTVAAAPSVELAVEEPPVVETPVVDTPAAEAVAETAEEVAETAEEVVTQTAETVEAVAEAVEAPIPETVTPAAIEPAPVFLKEFRMTVDPKTLFADFNDRTKAAMEKSAKTVEELNDFAKGNVEAIVESGKITAKGLEALSQEAVEYGRKSFETATAALKSMAGAKSPTDFFKLQSDFFRGAFDSYVAEASKTTEAVLKLAGEAAQPISSRVALAAEKAKIAA